MANRIYAAFSKASQAESAADALRSLGVPSGDVRVIARDEEETQRAPTGDQLRYNAPQVYIGTDGTHGDQDPLGNDYRFGPIRIEGGDISATDLSPGRYGEKHPVTGNLDMADQEHAPERTSVASEEAYHDLSGNVVPFLKESGVPAEDVYLFQQAYDGGGAILGAEVAEGGIERTDIETVLREHGAQIVESYGYIA
jgi:hypothetical protein